MPQKIRNTFSKEKRFLLLFIFAVVYIAAFWKFRIEFSEPDDVMMSYIANGSLAEPSWDLIYPNVIFGIVLRPFYMFVPSFNWYGLFLILTMTMSIVSWLFLVDQFELGLLGRLVVLGVAVVSFSYTTFTVAAYMAVVAGMSLVLAGMLRATRARFFWSIGSFLMIWGYMLRSNTLASGIFLFAGPLFGMLFAHSETRKQMKIHCICGAFLSISILLASSGVHPVLVGSAFVAYALLGVFWKKQENPKFVTLYSVFFWIGLLTLLLLCIQSFAQSDTQQRTFRQYTLARSKVVDSPYIPYDQISAELEAIGISENDYAMVTGWNFADKEVFSEDKLLEISKIMQEAYNPLEGAKKALQQVFVYPRILFLLFPPAMGIMMWLLTRKKATYIVLSVLAFWIFIAILLLRNRLVDRVLMPLSVGSALQMLLFAFGVKQIGGIRIKQSLQLLGIAAFVAVCFFQGRYLSVNAGSGEESEIAQYTKAHPDCVYLVQTNWYNQLFFDDIPILCIKKSKALENVIKAGSGDTFSPRQYKQMEKLGLSDPDRLLLAPATDKNVYYIDSSEKMYLQYLKEHDSLDTSCKVVKTFENGCSVYQFSDAEVN